MLHDHGNISMLILGTSVQGTPKLYITPLYTFNTILQHTSTMQSGN